MLGVVESAPSAVLPLPGVNSSGDELFRLGILYSTGQEIRRAHV